MPHNSGHRPPPTQVTRSVEEHAASPLLHLPGMCPPDVRACSPGWINDRIFGGGCGSCARAARAPVSCALRTVSGRPAAHRAVTVRSPRRTSMTSSGCLAGSPSRTPVGEGRVDRRVDVLLECRVTCRLGLPDIDVTQTAVFAAHAHVRHKSGMGPAAGFSTMPA